MQGVLVFLFALVAINYAQDVGTGGCCFFRQSNFVDEIRCTSSSFTISDATNKAKTVDGIGSFFCTERFSAAILYQTKLQELVDCGDVVNLTISQIPTDSVTVGECMKRRCCLYTGKNKDGNEYCVNTDAPPAGELPRVQATDRFVVVECLAEWQTTIQVTGGKVIQVACGETFDMPANDLLITSITTKPCAGPRAIAEAVVDYDDEFADQTISEFEGAENADQAVSEFNDDDFVALDQAFSDLALDQAVTDYEDEFVALDQAVTDYEDEFVALDLAVADYEGEEFVDDAAFEDQYVDQYADQAVVDADWADVPVVDAAAFEDQYADQYVDQAVYETTEEFVDEATVDAFDQAVGDNYDAAVGEEYVDQAFVDESFSDYQEDDFDNY